MSGPMTTWQDLANLGWDKKRVYDVLNAQRGGSMEGMGDMALNSGFALDWSWYCYNVLRGSLREDRPVVGDLPENNTIVWVYDNSHNTEPFTDTWTEKWTNSESASLAITNKASIELKTSINVMDVCTTDFGFSIATESTDTKTATRSYELSHTFAIMVNPGEKVTLKRTQTITQGTQFYYQDYGLDPNMDLIATKGKKYNGHYYWAYSANYYLNSPRGTIRLVGTMKKITFQFTLIREKSDGTVVRESMRGPTQAVAIEDGKKQAVFFAQPGEIEGPKSKL